MTFFTRVYTSPFNMNHHLSHFVQISKCAGPMDCEHASMKGPNCHTMADVFIRITAEQTRRDLFDCSKFAKRLNKL